MKSFLIPLSFLVCVGLMAQTTKAEEDETDDAWLEKYKPEWGKCQGEKLEFPKKLRDAQKTCEQFRTKSEDSKENVDNPKKGITCEAQCVWKAMDFLDDNDEISFKKYGEMLEEEFDGRLELNMLRISKASRDCKKELDLDVKDSVRCKRYKKFFSCIFKARKTQCKDEVKKGDKDSSDKAKLKKELAAADKEEEEKHKNTGYGGSNWQGNNYNQNQQQQSGGVRLRLGRK